MRKGLITKITLILLALTMLVSPFLYSKKVSANTTFNDDIYFIGVNVNVIDFETNLRISSISIPSTDIEMSSEFCQIMDIQYYPNTNYRNLIPYCDLGESGIQYQNFTYDITIPQTNLSVNYNANNNYLFEYTFVMKDNYRGNITINNEVYSVNGNEIKFTKTQNITTFTFSNINLERIRLNNWNFPIESYNIINSFFQRGYDTLDMYEHNTYMFPIFESVPNTYFISSISGANPFTTRLVIGLYENVYNITTFSSFFDVINGSIESVTPLFRYQGAETKERMSIISAIIRKSTDNNVPIVINAKSKFKFMPIYYDFDSKTNISTDFAINFGLSNSIINDLNEINTNVEIIKDGTNNTNSSVSNADSVNNDLTNSDNEYSTLENQFSSDLNTNLNRIDKSLNVTSNSSFLESATYIKNRFNWLTNNLPALNLLLTFSLLIGLTTLLIGKVFK